MTAADLGRLIEQYGAGVDAELALLRQLAEIATQQHASTRAADFSRFNRAADDRDGLMRNLVALEDDLRHVRQALDSDRAQAERVEGYQTVMARHRQASALVDEIIATDRESLAALANAELARRSASAGLERGENTLAAYRRVLAPPLANATLLDRVG